MLPHLGATRLQCPDSQTLGRLLRDELPGDEAGSVEEHVSACPDCQQALQRLVGSLPDTVGEFTVPLGRHPSEPPPALPGYEALTRLDAGGMGEVWRARDLHFGRNLAIKVMKTWASSAPRLVERFVAEAQISGQLTHPSIVPVHAMGRLADGRPYYTMRLVEGQTLAALLAGGPAPAERRLEFVQVFRQVCQALAFAHGRGVIHRDLKPENIMVGAHGEVQLMDWGLAKVLADAGPGEGEAPSAGSDREAPTRTSAGSVLGTVAYMAPEQARGLVAEVDRRSDVFGLGAILCQILTGAPPYAGADAEAVLRRAVAADLGGARARLRGCGADPELVGLAQRCLAADKADRPADAGAVAAAVTAYVSGVEERLQQERLERAREHVQAVEERRRRKLWMGLAAAVLAAVFLLAAGLAVVNHLRQQEQAAKDQAQRREQETRAVMDELSSTVIDDWLTRQPQLTPQQKEFLRKGLAYYENFTRETGQTPEGRAALARAYRRVGDIRRQLGLLPEAEEALQQAVGRSEALAREFPGVAGYQQDAAEAVLALVRVLWERGDHRRAVPLLDEAISRQEVVQRDLGDARGRASLAKLHFRNATLRTELRQWQEAETSFGAALTILKELDHAFAEDPDHRGQLAVLHHNWGRLFLNQEKSDKAEESFSLAVAILRQLADDVPSVREYQHRLAQGHIGRGVALWRLERLDEAGDAFHEALPLLQALAAEFRAVSKYRQDLAEVFNNLALVLEDQGRLEDSAAATRQAITLREQLVKENALVLDYAVTLGGTYGNLGHLLRDQGRPADSLEWYDKAVDTLESALAREERHATTRNFLRNGYAGRAQALDQLGRHPAAARDWDRVLALDDGKRRLFHESRRALSLGDHARAVALASEQAGAEGVNNKTVYDCARVCGLAAVAVKDDPALREQYAGRTAALIRKALDAGYKGPRLDVRKDDALDLLREREEFQQLLKQQETRAPARSPGPR